MAAKGARPSRGIVQRETGIMVIRGEKERVVELESLEGLS